MYTYIYILYFIYIYRYIYIYLHYTILYIYCHTGGKARLSGHRPAYNVYTHMQTSMFYCPIVVKGGSLIITIMISMIIIISSSIPIITAISHSSYCWLMLVKKKHHPIVFPLWTIGTVDSNDTTPSLVDSFAPLNDDIRIIPQESRPMMGLSGGWDDFRTWRPFLGILNITNIQVSVGDRIILSPFLLGDVENQDISFTFPLYHPFCWFSHHFSCLNLR